MNKLRRKRVWLLAVPLALLSVMLIGGGIALAQSLVGGNAVINRPIIDGADNFYLVDTNNPINMNGQVNAFEVFAGTTEPVTLVIYRQTGPGPVFSVVGISGQKTPVVGFNQFTLSTPIVVQAGDFVGLLNSSVKFTLDPPFNFNFGNLSGTTLFSVDPAGNPPSHSNATNLVRSSNRTYSVRVIGGPTNQPPVANDDAYRVDDDDDEALTVVTPGVLGNDSDPDSDPLTAVLNTSVSNGTLTLNVDGSFTYTPDEDFEGTDSFTYFANDGTVDSNNPATVTIIVGDDVADDDDDDDGDDNGGD